MENNKNFSEGFLNKLLESAIEYYNINVDNNSIKNKHSDVITAINSYKNALKFEAHKSMQKEIWNVTIEPEIKVRLTEKTGEIEFRMVEGADEYVQLESFLAFAVLQ